MEDSLEPVAAANGALAKKLPTAASRELPSKPKKPSQTEAKGQQSGQEPSAAKLTNYIRILKYGSGFDMFLMGLCVMMAVISGAAMPLMFLVFGRLVNNFTTYFVPGSGVTKEEFQHSVNRNSLFMVYIFVGRFVSSYVSMYAVRISGLRISGALRRAYLQALFSQPISMIDKISPGKVSTRITSSSNTIQLGISQSFVTLVQALALTVGLYVVSFIKSWALTLVASSCLPFIMLAYGISLPFFIKIHKKTEDLHEEASALSFEIFNSIRIVVAFSAEQRLHARYRDIVEAAKRNELKAGPLMGLMMAPMFFSNYATFALAFWFGISQYLNGHAGGVGSIVVVLFSVVMAVSGLGRIWSPIMSMTNAATASTELFATIDADVPDTTGITDIPVKTDIKLENVLFAYPSRPDVQVLHGVSVLFEAGKTTAIVGPSGSGKSTIVGLLERWYDLESKYLPNKRKKLQAKKDDSAKKAQTKRKLEIERGLDENTSEDSSIAMDASPPAQTGGCIMIGNVNLADVESKWWRSQIGLVQQEPFLFNDTIYQNVAFGFCGTKWQHAPEAEKRELVVAACKEAYAHEFIIKLPGGYDSVVGESGIKLSGGQRQRLAIARSIVKQPAILILDEATSAIDVRTERIVQRALDRVSRDRTTIVIAHRLSTIKKADKILVLRKGELIEQGSHDELLRIDGGVYHGLVSAQTLSMGENNTKDVVLDMAMADVDVQPMTEADDEKPAPAGIVPTGDTNWVTRTVFTSFGRLLYEQRSHYILYSVVAISAAAAAVVYPLQAFIFAKVINAFTLVGDELRSAGNFWALMFFVLAIGTGLAYFSVGWSGHALAQIVSTFYRSDYLRDILKKRIEFFDQEGNSAGTLTSILTGDPRQLQQLMGTEMSMALIAVFNLIGCMIISFVFGWKLSLVGVLAVLPVILLAGYWRIKLEIQFSKMNAAVFAESSQFGTEAVGAFRTVTSLIMEDVITQRYNKLLKTHVSHASKKALSSTIVFATSDSIDMLCQALVFWYGGRLMASFEYNVVQFFIIYMAVIQGSQAAGTWFSFAPNIAEATAASNRILNLRPTIEETERLITTPFDSNGVNDKQHSEKSGEPGGLGIEFRNVYFTYASRDVPVLTGLNLTIKPGQFAALVGASGCGKSTTISLLERFYDPTKGSILVGGQDITTVDATSYRNVCSLVAQESTLYEGTVKDNVTLSVDESEATEEAIHQACADAQIHDFITSLPEGYDTKLGPKGVQLSGGQRQRLALARALLRKPKVLLLDEATSSLDSESERLVQQAIERAAAAGGRTVLSVAHRLATVQKADIIFVLGSGQVLEQGTHQELLRLGGVYYQMCQAQALDR